MFICPECCSESNAAPQACAQCGADIDPNAPDYEQRLARTLVRCDASKRARICLSLGSRINRRSVQVLIKLLTDPDTQVRIAALRALGEIGDPLAMNAVERLTNNRDFAIQSVARHVLKMLIQGNSRRF